MHNLLRPEHEEGVSQLGLVGPEMEIARRNFIRRLHFHARIETCVVISRSTQRSLRNNSTILFAFFCKFDISIFDRE